MRRHLALTVALACALAASACVPMIPTGVDGKKKGRTGSESQEEAKADKDTTPAADTQNQQAAVAAFTGQVLGLNGQGAAGVSVKAYVISAGSGNVISAGSGNVISAGSGNVISAGSGNVISAGSGNYRIQQAPTEVKTDAEGRFELAFPADAKLNIEAVQEATVKAIQMEVTGSSNALKLQLAKTGTLSGKVTAPDAPSVTNFEGVDVFIPGTGYLAKADAAGNYTIPNVPVGTFRLKASKTGLGEAFANDVRVESEKTTTVSDMALTVKAPNIASIEPALVTGGMEVTLTGTNFGATAGKTFSVTFGGVQAEAPVRESDTTIKVKVPASAGNGSVVVSVEGIVSNGHSLTVLEELTLTGESELVKGRTYAFTATGVDSAGQTVASVPVSWSVTGSGLSIDQTGKLTMGAVADGQVKVTFGSLSKTFDFKGFPALYKVSTLVSREGEGGFGNSPKVQLQFSGPLATDAQDNVYLVDSYFSRYCKVTPAGQVSVVTVSNEAAVLDRDAGEQWQPQAAAIDAQGNMYVLNRSPGKIFKITPAGIISHIAGNGERGSVDATAKADASFWDPNDMILGKDGSLYVVEDYFMPAGDEEIPFRPQSFRKAGMDGAITTLTDTLTWPELTTRPGPFLTLAQDPAGAFWLAEGYHNAEWHDRAGFFRINANTVSTVAGGASDETSPIDGSGESAIFHKVVDMVVNSQGTAYAVDIDPSNTPRIRRMSASGAVTTVAGGTYGYLDGDGLSAKFTVPEGMAIDSQGNLYVSEMNCVRKIRVVEGN